MVLVRLFVALAFLGVAAATSSVGSDANAQQIYRIVGPDGRVTFSDQPPREPSAKATAAPVVALTPSGGGINLNGLTFEVRQAAGRFPVTLYTTANCMTCNAGRSMLLARGIPFAERTVSTGEDFEALKRLTGGNSLPFLTIGSQQLKGFGDSEWAEFLDAAGYPKTSQLPSSYVPNPATPMVAVDQPRSSQAATQARRPTAPTPDVSQAPPPENPAGIRF